VNHPEAIAELQAGKLRPVYLIYGGEPFLEEALFREIKARTVRPETADFNYHTFNQGPDQLGEALSVAQTQPFFSEWRLVVVKDAPFFSAPKKKKADEETEGEEEEKGGGGDDALLSYLKSPVPSTCLVFLVGGNVDSRKKTTKAVIATGGAVECKSLKHEEALMWAEKRAVSVYGNKLNDQAARLLIDKVGSDLRLIDNELQKLSLYVGDNRTIGVADVDTCVGGVAETEIYRLTEAVMLKDRAKAMDLLGRVLRQVDHPLQVLSSLANRFRQMITVKALAARGLSQQEGAAQAKMHPYAYKMMTGHVRPYAREDLGRAMGKLLEADLAIKTGFDPKLMVETLVVELMQ
jgi:DNA polymerase III subunit delta